MFSQKDLRSIVKALLQKQASEGTSNEAVADVGKRVAEKAAVKPHTADVPISQDVLNAAFAAVPQLLLDQAEQLATTPGVQECQVQAVIMQFIEAVLPILHSKDNGWFGTVADTSTRTLLTNPAVRPDVTVSFTSMVLWACLKTVFELTVDLHADDYHVCVGQLHSRARNMLMYQPTRKHVACLAIGRSEFELFRFFRDESLNERSGLKPFDLRGEGGRVIVSLLYASPEDAGCTAVRLPARFTCKLPDGQWRLIKDFRLVWDKPASRSTRGSQILTAISAPTSADGSPEVEVVVKVNEFGELHEVKVLRELEKAAVPHVPRVLAAGVMASGRQYLVLPNLGRPLTSDDPPHLIAQAGVCVAAALEGAHRCGYLHRDVSHMNIVVDEGGAISLLDFHLASPAAEALSGNGKIGTQDFLALALLLQPDAAPSISTDLEALWYSLIAMVVVERVPWQPRSIMPNTAEKFLMMTDYQTFESKVLGQCPERLRPLLRDLREIFWPQGVYWAHPPPNHPHTPSLTPSAASFMDVCRRHVGLLTPNDNGGAGALPGAQLNVSVTEVGSSSNSGGSWKERARPLGGIKKGQQTDDNTASTSLLAMSGAGRSACAGAAAACGSGSRQGPLLPALWRPRSPRGRPAGNMPAHSAWWPLPAPLRAPLPAPSASRTRPPVLGPAGIMRWL